MSLQLPEVEMPEVESIDRINPLLQEKMDSAKKNATITVAATQSIPSLGYDEPDHETAEIYKINGENKSFSAFAIEGYRKSGTATAEPFFELIQDENIKKYAKLLWENAPDYFFVIGASSSGKFHASWAVGEGGLVRHVLTAMQLVYDLSATYGLTDRETDLALAAISAHDLLKYGIDFDTRYLDMHPYLPRSYFGNKKQDGYVDHSKYLKHGEFDIIMRAIESHMGNLATGSWTTVGGLTPVTPIQQLVHIADNVASKKSYVMTQFKDI